MVKSLFVYLSVTLLAMKIPVCYQDEFIIAINKPHGLLVHRSPIAADINEYALQQLRNQLGCYVYPAHRIDRKTGGLLLFSFSPEVNRMLHQAFMNSQIGRTYHAIVRGYVSEKGIIDYPLKNDQGRLQDAVTHYIRLQTAELPIAQGKFLTSRYSLVQITPQTGRMHQIRRHFAHISHPVIGDRPYGCNKQNRLFLEKWNHHTMLLHAFALELTHPTSKQNLRIEAPYQPELRRIMEVMGWIDKQEIERNKSNSVHLTNSG